MGREPNQLAELRREFQHLQSLTHPEHRRGRTNTIATAMSHSSRLEYLSGLSLQPRALGTRALALGAAHARAIIRDIAAALAHAHGRGVVHGDLNPSNIFITDDGKLRVLHLAPRTTRSPGPPLLEHSWEEYTSVAAPRFASCQLLGGRPGRCPR